MKYIFLLLFSLALMACKSTNSLSFKDKLEMTDAEKLLSQVIQAHGGKRYNHAHYQFDFRGNIYTFSINLGGYEYTVSKTKDGVVTYDKMTNSDFVRMVDGKKIPLSIKDKAKYGSSLNSVIYFATLPYKLQDPAVNLEIKTMVSIKGKQYQVLQVSFDEVGGGKDHDDIYYFWINAQTKIIDYLAYNFHVNGGGVRFRSAYNTRFVDGIIFQDYVNYKAAVGTALADLPTLYDQGTLTRLSVIETEKLKKL